MLKKRHEDEKAKLLFSDEDQIELEQLVIEEIEEYVKTDNIQNEHAFIQPFIRSITSRTKTHIRKYKHQCLIKSLLLTKLPFDHICS